MSAVGMIQLSEDAVQVDAAIVAAGLALEPSILQQHMREGLITSLCERGVDEDQGRYRLTFFSQSRRFQIIVDDRGQVLHRFTLNVGARTARRGHHRP
jgi:Family of unknown function (DUF6522)